jgi:hypothetical protein
MYGRTAIQKIVLDIARYCSIREYVEKHPHSSSHPICEFKALYVRVDCQTSVAVCLVVCRVM